MGACEDGACRDIPPPQGPGGPWVLFCDANVNNGFPYWESLANLGAMMAANGAKPAPAEAPPPRDKPPEEEQSLM